MQETDIYLNGENTMDKKIDRIVTTQSVLGLEYSLRTNKNQTVDLIDTEGSSILKFDTDYKIYSMPDNVLIGRLNYSGNYLVYEPIKGKGLRHRVPGINEETITAFREDIARLYVKEGRL